MHVKDYLNVHPRQSALLTGQVQWESNLYIAGMNSNEKRARPAEYMRNYRKQQREKHIGEAANQPRHTTDSRQVQPTEDESIHRVKEAQRKRKFRRKQETEDETIQRRAEEAQRLREFRQMQTHHETEDETIERRAEEAHRLREFRQVQSQQETEDETVQRRAEEAQRLREFRQVQTQLETEDEAIERRAEEAQRTRVYRQFQLSNRLLEVYHHDNYDENKVEIHNCGLMNVECQFCHSLNFAEEKSSDNIFNYCCHKRTVLLDDENEAHREFPPLLKELLSNPNHPDFSNFKINIHSFNSTLSFASMGAQVDHVAGYGPYCFKIHMVKFITVLLTCIQLMVQDNTHRCTLLIPVWQMTYDSNTGLIKTLMLGSFAAWIN